MKKIIAAFDGLRFSESTLQYSIYLAKKYDAHIVGIFLKETSQTGYAVYATMVNQVVSGKTIFDEINLADKVATEKAIVLFETGCRKAKLNFSIHKDKKNALDELLHESTYADLLVIDAWETFSYMEASLPGWFIKNVLHGVQCPVLVVPKNFHIIKKLVLLFDGNPASVYALKMFTYILPEMSKLEARLLCVKHDSTSMHLPDNKRIKEWVKRHYSNITYQVLKGFEKEIVTTLKSENPGILVIAGAYHRSNFSMLFHKSIADMIIKDVRAPLFIAHS